MTTSERWACIGGFLVAGFVGGVVAGHMSAPAHAQSGAPVRVRKLELVNDSGTVVATLAVDKNGGGQLVLRNKDGASVVTLP